MKKPLVLVVDDEPQMVGIIAYALETQGFNVVTAYDGQQAIEKLGASTFDLVVLDVMLPKVDGFEVCKWVRENTMAPVILLTAKGEDEDVIRGLELGADDYITKPFNPREVALRAQAVLRRSGWGSPQTVLQYKDLQIDTMSHHTLLRGQPLNLTNIEYKLLLCLTRNMGRVLSWQSLLKSVWEVENWEGGKEMVKTAIYRLRQKIDDEPENSSYILTIRGVGYLMPPENP